MRHLLTFLLILSCSWQVAHAIDDETVNNSCDGELISNINGQSTYFSAEYGPASLTKTTDEKDYYTFTLSGNGTLTMYVSSQESTDVYMSTSACGADKVLTGTGGSAQLGITTGDTVYIMFDSKYNGSHDYGFDLVFEPAVSPTANDDSAQTLVDTPVDIDVTLNDTDDGSIDKSTVVISNAPLNGTVTVDGTTGVVTYTPDTGFDGIDNFDYTIRDNLNNISNPANVTIAVKVPTLSVENCDTGTQNDNRKFCLRKQIMLPGDMLTIGNTVLVAPGTESTNDDDSTICSTYTNGTYIDDATGSNDEYYLCKYHMDGNTTPATTAELTLPDPANSTIEWAGLYWQGLVDDTYVLETMNSTAPLRIKNGTSDYEDIGYDKLNYTDSGFTGTYSYAAFKDVTTILQDNNWTDGNYTVANVPVKEGKYVNLGTFGAWSLVVIYKNPDEKIRSFSVFDGYERVTSSVDADIGISGFYTAKGGDIHASVSAFTGEGDKDFPGDVLYVIRNSDSAQIALPAGSNNSFYSGIDGVTSRTPNPTNNQGIDIHTYQLGIDGVNVLSHEQSDIAFKFTSTKDVYWPSMLAFSSEVYTPSFCYDYAYQQNGVFITEENNDTTRAPRITGFVTDGDDLNVTLYIRNQEDSDVTAKNLRLDITDINTTQAVYKSNTVSILNPNEVVPLAIPDSSLTTSAQYIKNIQYADVAGKEFIYSYYTLTPSLPATLNHELNISLNGTFNYDLVLPLPSGDTVTIPSTSTLGGTNLPLCSGGNFQYITQNDWSIFNVVDTGIYAGGEKYNIPTQIARRPGNFSVVAYDPDASDYVTPDTNSTTLVGVDLIDAGAFHDIQATCSEATAGISPILWMNFDGTSTIDLNQEIADAIADDRLDIASVNDFYPNAVKSTAFRISYLTLNDGSGELIKTEDAGGGNVKLLNFTELVQDIGTCKQPVKKFPNSDLTTTNVPVACANAGNAGLSPFEVQRCLECLFGYNTSHICSRDNFSIRPESFIVKINDTNQSNLVTIRLADDRTGVAAPNTTQIDLAAGYDYEYEINATSHTGNEATPGYSRFFNDLTTSDYNVTLIWEPSDTAVNPFCNDINSHPQSFNMINGEMKEFGALRNVGEYRLNMIDKGWTKVDWDPAYMEHHADSTYYVGGLTAGADCQQNSSIAQANGVHTALVGGVLTNLNGCNIDTNNHDNADTGIKYRDYNISFHPYSFNVSEVYFTKGIDDTNVSANDYVYMNDVTTDANMSLRYDGKIATVGADNNLTSNFVAGCYAQNIDLDLDTSPLPASPNLNYRLIEVNASKDVISDTTGSNAGAVVMPSVMIPAANFTKALSGISDMEFNFNLDRNVSGAINPVSITYLDLNVSCTTSTDCQSSASLKPAGIPVGLVESNSSVTHIYGRLHTPRHRVADPDPGTLSALANIPLYYEFYCDAPGCIIQDYNAASTLPISPIGLLSPDDVRWYIQAIHNVSTDGNATQTRTRNGLDDARFAGGMSIDADSMGATYVYDGTKGYPYKATIELSTRNWLLYNRFNPAATVNDFELEFTTTGNWSGRDESGMGLDGNSSTNVNRRVEW